MGEAKRRKRSLKPGKVFDLELKDIPHVVDAVFDGHREQYGYVYMAVSPDRGRKLVEGMFPGADIEWGKVGPPFPDDWIGFEINLIDPGAPIYETRVPLEIIPRGQTIMDASPNQLAFLLAYGVRRDGGRSAIWECKMGEPRLSFFTGRPN